MTINLNKVRCLDSLCFRHNTALYLKELAKQAEARGIRFVATSEPLPAELRRLKYRYSNRWDLPKKCTSAEGAELLVIWGDHAGEYYRKVNSPKSPISKNPPLNPEELMIAKSKKNSRLKFAKKLMNIEILPPRPADATLIKLCAILGVGWLGEGYGLRDLDELESSDLADKVWCKCVSEFARRAKFAQYTTLADQDTLNDEIAAKLCGFNWSEFENETEEN